MKLLFAIAPNDEAIRYIILMSLGYAILVLKSFFCQRDTILHNFEKLLMPFCIETRYGEQTNYFEQI